MPETLQGQSLDPGFPTAGHENASPFSRARCSAHFHWGSATEFMSGSCSLCVFDFGSEKAVADGLAGLLAPDGGKSPTARCVLQSVVGTEDARSPGRRRKKDSSIGSSTTAIKTRFKC
jgi:hypothetical protein